MPNGRLDSDEDRSYGGNVHRLIDWRKYDAGETWGYTEHGRRFRRYEGAALPIRGLYYDTAAKEIVGIIDTAKITPSKDLSSALADVFYDAAQKDWVEETEERFPGS